jgi:hypothetical protein
MKLIGNPLESFRTRVSHVSCGGQQGNFTIVWNTAGTFSGLRKTAGIVTKTLVPAKVYSKYAINIKNLGGKQNRAFFNYYVKKFIEGIHKGITMAACGRATVTQEKLKTIAEAVAAKIPEQTKPDGESEAPPKDRAPLPQYPTIKVPYGIASIAVADYISGKLGVDCEIHNGEVAIHIGSIQGKLDMLKRGIGDYVSSRYEKLKGDLVPVLAYLAIVKYNADCTLLEKIINGKPTPKALQEALNKHF